MLVILEPLEALIETSNGRLVNSMKNPVNILITGAGTATCQSVIKGLRNQHSHPVRIVTADSNPNNAGRYLSDAFFEIPSAKEERFIPALLQLCHAEEIQLFIPIVDWEFEKLSQAKKEFEKINCKVIISEHAVIELCDDKWKTYHFFLENKIPTPETFIDPNAPLPFPVFVKPRTMGRASLNTHIAGDKKELDFALEKVPNPLIQKIQKGREYTIDTLCDFNGKFLNAVIRERIETKSGVSYKGRTVLDSDILQNVTRILEKLPIIGPANIQCFKQQETISFIEINPRFSGGLALSLAAGFNSPLLLLKIASGETVTPHIGSYKEGIQMYRYWQEVFTDDSGNQLPSLI